MYKSECRLSGATRLMLELMIMKGGKSPQEAAQISSALCPYIWNYTEEFGWEEAVYAALTFLKSQVVSGLAGKLESKKLKKVIKSVLEKVGKVSNSAAAAGETDQGKKLAGSGERTGENETLIGNEIQERMTSARGRRTRPPHNPVLESIPEPAERKGVANLSILYFF